jgi:hypothetical protein
MAKINKNKFATVYDISVVRTIMLLLLLNYQYKVSIQSEWFNTVTTFSNMLKVNVWVVDG